MAPGSGSRRGHAQGFFAALRDPAAGDDCATDGTRSATSSRTSTSTAERWAGANADTGTGSTQGEKQGSSQ